MSKKGCELCSNGARMFCESDQASLCWDCDEKVHGANFLVAKHSRTLLCHVCHSQTPWKAAGPKLGQTVSVCHACSCSTSATAASAEPQDGYDSHSESEEDDDDDDGEYFTSDSDDGEEEEEEGENQVVPWSSTSASTWTRGPYHSDEQEDEDEDEDGCCDNYNCNYNDSSLMRLSSRPLKIPRKSN